MNQPKFKFDDVVQRPDSKEGFSFRATQIQKHKGEYLYSHVGGDWHREDSLELVKEPQKKKLYAYSDNREVKFATFENYRCEFKGEIFTRYPEYDIEYPEVK